MTSFAITHCGQCCRGHVVGQRIISDISEVRSCGICNLCSESNNFTTAAHCCTRTWKLEHLALRTKHTLPCNTATCTWWP